MTADLYAALDVYVTGIQIVMWAGSAIFAAAHLALAWLVIAVARNTWAAIRRAHQSFAAAHQLCRDIETEHRRLAAAPTDQPRKEDQPT